MPPKEKLTNAQKQANYRARRDLDPERRRAYIEEKKTKYREDLQKGKRLAAKDLSQRQLRQQRKQWRTNKRNSRKPITAPQMTPPRSPSPEDQP